MSITLLAIIAAIFVLGWLFFSSRLGKHLRGMLFNPLYRKAERSWHEGLKSLPLGEKARLLQKTHRSTLRADLDYIILAYYQPTDCEESQHSEAKEGFEDCLAGRHQYTGKQCTMYGLVFKVCERCDHMEFVRNEWDEVLVDHMSL